MNFVSVVMSHFLISVPKKRESCMIRFHLLRKRVFVFVFE